MASRLSIQSDGTTAGTQILHDGEPLQGISRISIDVNAETRRIVAVAALSPLPFSFGGKLGFVIAHPVSGVHVTVKAIEFADGTRWEAPCSE